MSNAVEFERVSRHFGETRAVDSVSMEVKEGHFFAMLGPSGSGKTTFLKLVSILEEPKEGKLFLFGKEMNKLNKKEILSLKKELGIVFENNYFIENMNVQENIVFPLIY